MIQDTLILIADGTTFKDVVNVMITAVGLGTVVVVVIPLLVFGLVTRGGRVGKQEVK